MADYFKDKVVIVTGASKGIGRSMVYSLLASGAKVAGIARTRKLLDEITADSGNLSGEFIGVVCDVTDRDSVNSSMRSITGRFGVADILINNAGMGLVGPALRTSEEEVAKCFDVNFYTAVHCIDYIAPKMIERKSGTIVNVASVVAKYGLPTVSFYSAAKAALSAYSQSLRTELAPAGINVITVYPGNTDTEFQRSKLVTKNYVSRESGGKQLSPGYVAEEILKAIRGEKAEVVIGRQAKLLLLLKSLSLSFVEYALKKQFDISKWYRKRPREETTSFSYIDESIKSGIVLEKMDKQCHYHRSTEFVNWWNVLPEGMQPSLYYVLYPYLLATTYGGNIPAQPYICPTSEGSEFIFIKRKPPDLIERVKNLIKTLLSPIRPMGRVKVMPEVEVGGKSFPFDLGKGGTVCPAAFRSFFPFLARSHLLPVKDMVTPAWRVCCPDHSKNLNYGGGEPDDGFFESICFWGKSAEIKTQSACKLNKNISSNSLEEVVVKRLGFPCPTLLSVGYGYYLTLAKGGELAFYSNRFEAAVFQCPNPKSRVFIEISRNSEVIDFKVLDVVGGSCARGITKDDLFSLPRDPDKNGFCLDAFNSLFLYSGFAEFLPEPLNVRCVLGDCHASWTISKSAAD